MIDFSYIRGAIFDIDGTLLDSMWMWHSCEAEYLRRFGVTPRPHLVEELRTLSLVEVAVYFQSEYGISKSVQEITDEKNAMIEEFYFEKAALKPGAIQLLEGFAGLGIKMCVATATDKYLVESALRRLGVLGYFGKIFTCGDEKTSKNSPDIFLAAARFLGTEISRTVVVEDALHAIKSAKKAGFPVLAVYDQSADVNQGQIRSMSDCYFETLEEMLSLIRNSEFGIRN